MPPNPRSRSGNAAQRCSPQPDLTAAWWRAFTGSAAITRPADRPLRFVPVTELSGCWARALAAADGALGAHCIHELWMRRDLTLDVDAALERLWQCAAGSIPHWLPMRAIEWLPLAYEVTATFRAAGRGRTNIYLVLLDYSDSRAEPHGVYVGMSRYTPEQRFDQHKAGIRAAGSVLRRGLEVLTGPTLHLRNIKRENAIRLEAELAAALRDAGIFVQGGH